MYKNIAIIFDEIHSLIEKIKSFIELEGSTCNLIHWTELTNGSVELLNEYNAVYLDRMGETTNSYQTQIASLGYLNPSVKVVNNPSSYWLTRNKVLTALEFKKYDIPHPDTTICYNFDSAMKAIDNGHKKMIAKGYLGYCAKEVKAFNKDAPPIEFIKEMLNRDGVVLFQEFIENNGRFIWRVDVVDKEIVVINQRFNYNEGEFPICNGTMGGDITFHRPEDTPVNLKELVSTVIDKMNLNVAGIDILIDPDNNPIVIEVNPEPDITTDRFEFPKAIASFLLRTTGEEND